MRSQAVTSRWDGLKTASTEKEVSHKDDNDDAPPPTKKALVSYDDEEDEDIDGVFV